MSLLLPVIRPPTPRSGGIADRATAGAIGSLETWAIELVRQLSKLDVTAGGTLVGGVSDVNGGTNITVSPTTGSVTVSLNDSIALAGSLSVGTTTTLNGSLTITTMTQGSVLFAGVGGLVSQDNTHLFWDDATDCLTVTATTAAQAIKAIATSATQGSMSIQNTNASGPVDFFAIDSTGTARMSFGYGNASYSDTARVGRGYVWRNTGVNFVFARTNTVDAMLFSNGNWNLGTSTSDPGVKLQVQGNIIGTGTLRIDGNSTLGNASTDTTLINGELQVDGGMNITHINWAGDANKPTFIRAGENAGSVSIGDVNTGGINLGSATNHTLALGNLSCNGNLTAGNASTDTVQVNGYAGFGAGPDPNAQIVITQASTRQYGVYHTDTPSGTTLDRVGAAFQQLGTYDCTAAGRTSYGVIGSAAGTRSAGANSLVNIGVYGNATGGQANYSFYGIAGTLYNAGSLQIDGNCTLGNATSDAHTVNGTLVVCSGAVGASALAGLDLVVGRNAGHTVAGTTNDIAIQHGGGGGYRHWISTEHNTVVGTGNAMHWWLNTGATAGASSAPGTGNVKVFTLTSEPGAVFWGYLAVDGNTTLGNASGDTITVNGITTTWTTSAALVSAGNFLIDSGINADIELTASSGAQQIYLNGEVRVESSGGTARNLYVGGSLTVNADITVNDDLDVTDALSVGGVANLNGNANICNAAGDTLKFHGGTGATQQTVTGSRGGNAALADLLTKLATLGLIVDGTSA